MCRATDRPFMVNDMINKLVLSPFCQPNVFSASMCLYSFSQCVYSRYPPALVAGTVRGYECAKFVWRNIYYPGVTIFKVSGEKWLENLSLKADIFCFSVRACHMDWSCSVLLKLQVTTCATVMSLHHEIKSNPSLLGKVSTKDKVTIYIISFLCFCSSISILPPHHTNVWSNKRLSLAPLFHTPRWLGLADSDYPFPIQIPRSPA